MGSCIDIGDCIALSPVFETVPIQNKKTPRGIVFILSPVYFLRPPSIHNHHNTRQKMIFGLLFCTGYVIGFIQLGMYQDVDSTDARQDAFAFSPTSGTVMLTGSGSDSD